MFKVVIDATPITPMPSGVGLHLLNLIDALYKLQASENFQLGLAYQPGFKNWLRRNFSLPECLQNYTPQYQLPLPTRISNALLDRFPQFFPNYLEPILDKPDLFHGTNYNTYPFSHPQKIINIYDLTFIKYPDYIDSVVKQYQKRVINCLRWSDLIITSSEHCQKEIIEYLDVSPQKIWVTPLASRYQNYNLSQPISKELIQQYQAYLSQPYILFVGTLEPRKNINNLLKSFNYLKEKYKIEHNLILIGQKGWLYRPILTAIENSPWRHCIHHLGYLSDEVVAMFYQKAELLAYPSYYEGFGLPVLEAMTLGTPVVTSNSSSLPEVAGDAALLVNPHNSFEIAEAILAIINDSQLRHNLKSKGKERAKQFSWKKTAHLTLDAYKSLF
ncbi:MAG: glycosyltransferase family 4 protein [Xenococcaceae cyanobacterium]